MALSELPARVWVAVDMCYCTTPLPAWAGADMRAAGSLQLIRCSRAEQSVRCPQLRRARDERFGLLVEHDHARALLHLLQALLGLPTPLYRHHRLLTGPDGRRFAKRDKAETLRELRAQGMTPDEVRREMGFG